MRKLFEEEVWFEPQRVGNTWCVIANWGGPWGDITAVSTDTPDQGWKTPKAFVASDVYSTLKTDALVELNKKAHLLCKAVCSIDKGIKAVPQAPAGHVSIFKAST